MPTILLARAYAVMPFVWSIGTILGPGRILHLTLLPYHANSD